MQKTSIYLIHWYGPFQSISELKEWEAESPLTFNLYIFRGRKNGIDRYYPGMTFKQGCVWRRMKNSDHHIHEFEGEDTEQLEVWIGAIQNKRANEYDVRICENLITSDMANVIIGEEDMVNQTNKKPPVVDVYVLNEWWKPDGENWMRHKRNSVPSVVHDVMMYYAEKKVLYGTDNLKFIACISDDE